MGKGSRLCRCCEGRWALGQCTRWVKNTWGGEMLSGICLCETGGGDWPTGDTSLVTVGVNLHPLPLQTHILKPPIQHPWVAFQHPPGHTMPGARTGDIMGTQVAQSQQSLGVWAKCEQQQKVLPFTTSPEGSDDHLRSLHLMDEGQTSSSQLSHHVSRHFSQQRYQFQSLIHAWITPTTFLC